MATKDEITLLQEKLSKLEKQLEERHEPTTTGVDKKNEREKINQDDYIRVMSLIPYNLNLSTKQGGQGSIKKFTKFGEVKRIMYRDLVDILEVHSRFLEAGYFYILNPAVIRQHGLDEIYSKILTKENIEKILEANTEDCVDLYNSSNSRQQEVIIRLLMDKVKDSPDSVNLNIVDRISRVSGVDIIKAAEEARESDKELLEQNK